MTLDLGEMRKEQEMQKQQMEAINMQVNLSLRDMALTHAEKAAEVGVIDPEEDEVFNYAKRAMTFLTTGN